MSRCGDIEFLIQDYLEGYLLPSQREELERHVAACPDCRSLLGGMRRLDTQFVDLPSVDAPENLGGRILDSIPRPSAGERRKPWMSQAFTALAATVVLVAGFLFGTRYGMQGAEGTREVEIVFHAPAASSVAVVGDFNGWNARRHPMTTAGEGGVWRIRLRLKPGLYEYGFLVDGQDWRKDPQADRFFSDGFGGENSVLFIES